MASKKQSPLFMIALYTFLIVFTLIYMSPFLGAVVTSLRTQDDISLNGFWSLPSEIVFSNYGEAWTKGGVSNYLLNSFIITIPALIGTIFLSSLSAFALARYKFPGNQLIYFMYVAGTMLPFQILLLPVFLMTTTLGLYDTYLGVIMIHVTFQMGFCTFVLRNFMKTLPGEVMDAARIDGPRNGASTGGSSCRSLCPASPRLPRWNLLGFSTTICGR